MRIVILTSSRADYGIYLPLLKKLKSDKFFNLNIIAFGTHLSRFHGYTIEKIYEDGFDVAEKLETLILGDSETAISNAIGNTITKFSSLWERLKEDVDLVFALGDRYEMFAAVAASVPFNIRIAHLHGGETTLGAIDNIFRHAITHMSTIHFTATELYACRVRNMVGNSKDVFNVGSLSLDNILDLDLYSKRNFKEKYSIDLNKPTILSTLHPETALPENNWKNAKILSQVFVELSKNYQIVITMPNADTFGTVIREQFQKLIKNNSRIIGVESFGTLGYFSCMKHCSFLLGNTSSGLIEAPSLKKYVVNIGERQAGRARSENIFDVGYDLDKILHITNKVAKLGNYTGQNIYKSSEPAVNNIVTILKQLKI